MVSMECSRDPRAVVEIGNPVIRRQPLRGDQKLRELSARLSVIYRLALILNRQLLNAVSVPQAWLWFLRSYSCGT